MRPGFWHKCRVGFRWLRISVWLAVLAALCALIWFNRVGLPDLFKTRLVAMLHERGFEVEFSRMRLRFTRGIVADNVRIGGAQDSVGPVLTVGEAQLRLDFAALLHGQLQMAGLFLRQGKFVWPLSPTNRLQLENIQAALRFQTNDTWSLDHFAADFAGAKLGLGGDVRHAPELRGWEMFHGSNATNHSVWMRRLQNFSDTLARIRFSSPPHLDLILNGDARDPQSFQLRVNAAVPAVRTPWFEAEEMQIIARVRPAASAKADAAWGIWTNAPSFQAAWTCQAAKFKAEKLTAERLECGGSWSAPELAVTNLSLRLAGGWLATNAKLNVATRALVFTNAACFDLHALGNFLPAKTSAWLTNVSWTQPPAWQLGGTLVLPAWTNASPDWVAVVKSSATFAGRLAFTNVTMRGLTVDRAQASFSYAKLFWDFSDVAVVRAETRLELGGSEDEATGDFRCQLRGAVDPEAARPFLTDSNAARGFALVKFTTPLALDVAVHGRLSAWESVAIDGQLALTNFSVRGQQFGEVTAAVNYTNGVLAFLQPRMHHAAQTATADAVTLDFNRRLLFFKNVLSSADPEPVVRAIGPKTWKLVEPYHFLSPPVARVNGQIPLGDLHSGPEMAAVDMRFDIIKGAPFEWLRLKTTNIVGTLHWCGQTLLLTNAVAAFHGGTAQGFVYFDFRVPHDGADYNFTVEMTNVNLHSLAADLSSPTNSLAGTLAGWLVVTSASTENLQSWVGFGEASLHNGLLWDVPIVSIVSPVLNSFSPGLGNSRATEATGRFRIANGMMTTDNLEIRSTMTRLEYVGTIDLNQNVNAHVTAHLLRDTWVVGPLVSTALWPVSKIFEYHVTGPLQNPRSEPIFVLPKLLLLPLHPIRTLEDIIPGGSPTNRPPGN